MDSITGSLRGMGKSIGPMVVSLFGVCAVRMFWVWSIFPKNKSLSMLMVSYPVSYVITIALTGAMLYYALKKYKAAGTSRNYGIAHKI
jgi:Na+-driven multidrug efflux pump